MTKLVVVESPAKAKTIARFLGRGYKVMASYGHIRDLPEKADEIPASIKKESWARFGVDLDGDFTPHYVVPASKKKYVDALKKAAAEADELLLATDEDREGESISWHITQVLEREIKKRNLTVSRIVFHEITPEAIAEAVRNPRQVNAHLVSAQESRRILDRLYGYSLSPVLWKKVQSGLSAGRVQSVAVRLIVEREEERRAFVSSEYWDLEAAFDAPTGEFKAGLARLGGKRLATGKDFDAATGKLKAKTVEVLDGKQAKALSDDLGKRLPWRVLSLESKPGVQTPGPPFTTSTLQQEANRKLGYGAERTMRIAQRLYEGVDLGNGERIGLITYMRTDSVTLSERALHEAADAIAELYGKEYQHAGGPRRYRTKTRNAQEAHEAIRPTQLNRRPQDVASSLEPDELKIYDLIWKRTLASQMADARVQRTNVEIGATATSGVEAVFTAAGKRILFPGYLRAYVEGSDDPAAEIGDRETLLPDLQEGQQIPARASAPKGATSLTAVTPKQHVTTPPARYTEASLVKKLEEEGVGRPSTYASIIGTIQSRGYVFQEARTLVPTFTAMAVTNLLREHFGDYVDIGFTARMEEELDQVADGAREWRDHVAGFYRGVKDNGKPGRPGLKALIEERTGNIAFPDVVLGIDPTSGESVGVRIGRYGPYVARGKGGDGNIATVPEKLAPADFRIEHALALINARAEGPRVVGIDPASQQKVYVARGRFGPYVQLGENSDEQKPRRASLAKGQTEEGVTLAEALELLSLPRELGEDQGEKIIANIGRFGPYVQRGKEFRSLKAEDSPYTVTLERALALLAEPKGARRGGSRSKTVLKEVGTTDGKNVQVLDGQYGPYVTDGETNATLPKGSDPAGVTMEQAAALLAAKAASGGGKKRPAARKGAKKAAKK